MSKFEGGQAVLVEGTFVNANGFGRAIVSFTDGPLGNYGFGEGTLHAKWNYVVADRQHQELAAQAKELHALLSAGSHENAVRTVQDLLDAAKRAKQPQLAAGECWVRARLMPNAVAAQVGHVIVQLSSSGANSVPKADVVQSNLPVLEIDSQALVRGRMLDQLWDLLGASDQDQAVAKISQMRTSWSNGSLQVPDPVLGRLYELYHLLGVATQEAAVHSIQLIKDYMKAFGMDIANPPKPPPPVHAIKIDVGAEPDVANMTEHQKSLISGPNGEAYGGHWVHWVPGQGWCNEPAPTAGAVPGPKAAEKAVAAAQVAQEPAKPPSEPLTPEQLAKVRVGDYVLVRVKVRILDSLTNRYPVKAVSSTGNEWFAKDEIVGHEPAPFKPVEAPCRAKHLSIGHVQVLHVDEDEALIKDAEGMRRIVLVRNLERLPDN